MSTFLFALFMKRQTIMLDLKMKVRRERWLVVYFFSHQINENRQLKQWKNWCRKSKAFKASYESLMYFELCTRGWNSWSHFILKSSWVLCLTIWITKQVSENISRRASAEITLQSLRFNIHWTHQHIDFDCVLVILVCSCLCLWCDENAVKKRASLRFGRDSMYC